jgi:hypothetical protein
MHLEGIIDCTCSEVYLGDSRYAPTFILVAYRMRPLTHNDIESELSYAYLHAVAAHAGASCGPRANR